MPHLTIEYSANLDGDVDMKVVCSRFHETMQATGIYPLAGIRVRALRADAYAVGDQLSENAFAHLLLQIGVGRTAEVKRQAGDDIMACAEQLFVDQLSKPHFALSLEVRELDPKLSWKTNSIHPRLADAGS